MKDPTKDTSFLLDNFASSNNIIIIETYDEENGYELELWDKEKEKRFFSCGNGNRWSREKSRAIQEYDCLSILYRYKDALKMLKYNCEFLDYIVDTVGPPGAVLAFKNSAPVIGIVEKANVLGLHLKYEKENKLLRAQNYQCEILHSVNCLISSIYDAIISLRDLQEIGAFPADYEGAIYSI